MIWWILWIHLIKNGGDGVISNASDYTLSLHHSLQDYTWELATNIQRYGASPSGGNQTNDELSSPGGKKNDFSNGPAALNQSPSYLSIQWLARANRAEANGAR